MSLLIRLPLNGNLNNYGSASATATNNGATVDDDNYTFDGNDDYISLNCSTIYNIIKGGSVPFTVSFWVYHADSTRAILFGDYGLSGAINFNIELNTSHQVRFYWNGSPDYTDQNISVEINEWTHVALTYDGSALRFYTNGVLTNTRNGALDIKNKTTGLYYLGRDSRTGTTALNGKLKDFRIYDTCLSESEIDTIAGKGGLQLWFPLNGNLNNQGLSNIGTSGSLTYVDGKLGKAGSGSFIITTATLNNIRAMFNSGGDFTISFWLKYSEATTGDIITYGDSSGTGTRLHIAVNNNVLRFGFRADDYDCPNSMVINRWYHITCTYSNNVKSIYIDGVLQGTKSSGKLSIPETYLSFGLTKCNMNDFRLYNRCLSEKEIKEIAKGLVLHYKLSGVGNENLIPNYDTSFLSYQDGTTTLFTNQMNGGTQEIVSNINGAKKCIHFHSLGGNNRQYRTLSAYSGKTYTISADYYSPNSQTTSWGGELNGGNYSWTKASATYTTPGKWQRLSYTYSNLTSDATIYYFIYCANGDDCYVKNIKIEEGSVATPWTPNSSDSKYHIMGYDNNIEYDLSGYKNNGIKVGTFTYTTDTPKYNSSTHFNSTSSYIQTTNLTTTGFGNSYSFSWWAKISSVTPMHWGFSDGIRLNGMYTGRLWNTGDSSNNPLYNPGTTTQVTAPTVNVWHHWVMTGDGTTCKVYKDGVLWATAKTYKAISGTTIIINGWDTSTSYSSDNYSISDFRIYATALSAEDVQFLYQSGSS